MLEITVGIILILVSIFLIVAVLFQSSKNARLSGAIAGGAETFFGKAKITYDYSALKDYIAGVENGSINITVTEEDKDKEYQKMADMYHVELESVKEFFDVEILTDSILMTKAADFVIENAVALPEPKEEEKAEEAEAPAEEKKPAKKTTRKSTKKAAEPKEEEAAPAEATEE